MVRIQVLHRGKIEVWMKGTLFYYEYASDYG